MPFLPAPRPCWLILIEGDRVGCGACWGQATTLAAEVWAEELEAGAKADGPPVIERADGLCVLLACHGCGERALAFGRPAHWAGMVDALKDAAERGWVGDACPACIAADLMP
ncbi:hypothetical protein [Micromonospora okii]|uniref:hypothetical protein n=1 Tax=Micromonospora okii TaxID=1182970 RepID=UPI001E457441|nr:hypothetical protein [Micromonospora okii]